MGIFRLASDTRSAANLATTAPNTATTTGTIKGYLLLQVHPDVLVCNAGYLEGRELPPEK